MIALTSGLIARRSKSLVVHTTPAAIGVYCPTTNLRQLIRVTIDGRQGHYGFLLASVESLWYATERKETGESSVRPQSATGPV